MKINNILAGLAVEDFAAALKWYGHLFDRSPDSRPMDGVAEWHSPDGGWLQLFEDEARAGSSSVTLAVGDLDRTLETLRAKGIAIGQGTASDVVKTAEIADPDGNRIILAEALSESIAK